jgi:hypothetical protein
MYRKIWKGYLWIERFPLKKRVNLFEIGFYGYGFHLVILNCFIEIGIEDSSEEEDYGEGTSRVCICRNCGAVYFVPT